MHKTILFMAVLAVSVLFCGCASVQTTTPDKLNGENLAIAGNTVAHINVENWGFYFFMFPLITGSTENPGQMEFFKDTVKADNAVQLLTKTAKTLNANSTINMVSRHSTFVWMLGTRSVQVSANAIK